ncbi:MAG: beta-ketoacyl synthase N-terminal-like domain-containing protein [Phycisphaerales bacterium]
MAEPIAITGLGVVSAFGVGIEAFWDGLTTGRCMIREPETLDASSFACQLAAEAPPLAMKDHLPKHYRKFARVMARDIELAVVAAYEAAASARLGTGEDETRAYEPHRLGTHIGAALLAPEIPELARAMRAAKGDDSTWDMHAWGETGMGQLTPLWMLKYLPNMLACHVSILHEAKGPSNTITAGEASGLLSIGEAMRVIERGDADASLAGSGDSRVNHLAIERLCLVGRLAETRALGQVDPATLVRPFSPDAIGSVPGEGAAVCVLERANAAESRGVEQIATLLGFGASQAVPPLSDGAPVMAGLGASAGGTADGLDDALTQAMRSALRDAGTDPSAIDAIFCHGAGERALDEAEQRALHAVFGDRASEIELCFLSPMLGETMAAGGSLLLAAAALALRHRSLPARPRGGAAPDDLRASAAESRVATLEGVLVCTHALGGQCAAVVLGR